MKTAIRNAFAAIIVAAAGLTASAPAATAGDVGFSLSIGGGGGGIVIGNRGHRGGWDRFERHRGHRDVCRPHRAVRKARHMGVRHADVVRAGRGRVVVAGFKHRRPVRVVFANERRCPVIAVRRR